MRLSRQSPPGVEYCRDTMATTPRISFRLSDEAIAAMDDTREDGETRTSFVDAAIRREAAARAHRPPANRRPSRKRPPSAKGGDVSPRFKGGK